MGKRELLIAAAFVVMGMVAWRLTAPPPPGGVRPFSLDTLAEIWRNRNTATGGRASVTTDGVLPVSDTLTEVRLANLVAVDVRGEARADIAWTLQVDTTGPSDAAAHRTAELTRFTHDEIGPVLALGTRSPEDVPRAGTLTLRVPSRLTVRVETARRTHIAAVAGVRLENLVGDTTLTSVAGSIDGAHGNGDLTIDDSRDVTLTLAGSRTTIRRSHGAVALTARNGETRIEQATGRVDADTINQRLTIIEPAREVRVGGVGGEITIERPRAAVDVDARRSHVQALLDRAVPITVFSAEGEVTLSLPDHVPISLDVEADTGRIDATAIGLTPIDRDGRSRIIRTVDEASRVAVRGDRSGIVIVRMK